MFTVPFMLCFFVFALKAVSKYKARAAYIQRGGGGGGLAEGFLRCDCRGLTFGGDYFRNFTVL